jgi:hypothetical protein
MWNMMRSMFGISYFAPSGLLISWLCHFIPLHGMLRYAALSGLSDYSPEGVIYANDGYSHRKLTMVIAHRTQERGGNAHRK